MYFNNAIEDNKVCSIKYLFYLNKMGNSNYEGVAEKVQLVTS